MSSIFQENIIQVRQVHKCESAFTANLSSLHFEKGATSNIDDVLHDHDELPLVPPLADHLVVVLINANFSSLCNSILKIVPPVILMMFSMIMLSFPMSPLSLST